MFTSKDKSTNGNWRLELSPRRTEVQEAKHQLRVRKVGAFLRQKSIHTLKESPRRNILIEATSLKKRRRNQNKSFLRTSFWSLVANRAWKFLLSNINPWPNAISSAAFIHSFAIRTAIGPFSPILCPILRVVFIK